MHTHTAHTSSKHCQASLPSPPLWGRSASPPLWGSGEGRLLLPSGPLGKVGTVTAVTNKPQSDTQHACQFILLLWPHRHTDIIPCGNNIISLIFYIIKYYIYKYNLPVYYNIPHHIYLYQGMEKHPGTIQKV